MGISVTVYITEGITRFCLDLREKSGQKAVLDSRDYEKYIYNICLTGINCISDQCPRGTLLFSGMI